MSVVRFRPRPPRFTLQKSQPMRLAFLFSATNSLLRFKSQYSRLITVPSQQSSVDTGVTVVAIAKACGPFAGLGYQLAKTDVTLFECRLKFKLILRYKLEQHNSRTGMKNYREQRRCVYCCLPARPESGMIDITLHDRELHL